MLPQQRLTLKQFTGYYFIISPIYSQQTAGNWAKCQISSQLQKTQPASRGTAELRVPCRLSGGKLALHIKEGRNDNFVTVLYLLLVGLLGVRSRTKTTDLRIEDLGSNFSYAYKIRNGGKWTGNQHF